jgi:hypothetical protein
MNPCNLSTAVESEPAVLPFPSQSESRYDRRSVGQSVLVSMLITVWQLLFCLYRAPPLLQFSSANLLLALASSFIFRTSKFKYQLGDRSSWELDGFSQSLQIYSKIVLEIRPLPLSSTSFSIIIRWSYYHWTLYNLSSSLCRVTF